MEERVLDSMAEKNEIVQAGKSELLDIFIEDEDKRGADLLEMSDFSTYLLGK